METISISNLKAHLSSTIRRVCAGNRIVVLDRDIPVAEISPYPHEKPVISLRPPIKKKMSLSIRLKTSPAIDPVDYLLEERQRQRQ